MTQPGEEPPGRAFGALRHRDFRLFWTGAIISQVGTWMQQIAQGWLLYDLTGSAFAVGLVGLIRLLPFLGMSLYAGTVVDRVDRRKLLMRIEVLNFLVTAGFGALVASGHVQV